MKMWHIGTGALGVGLVILPRDAFALDQFIIGFETPTCNDWSFDPGGGCDVNKGNAHTGNNNMFVRHSSGWLPTGSYTPSM